jgi:two-component system, chemotaxis family, chemotaxis protein CheY
MGYLLSTASIIDDDQVYQLVMKKTIEHTGLIKSVLQFYDGEQALVFFKANQEAIGELPELILLDINMPTMNGWEFLDEFIKLDFKNKYKSTIFIVSSSSVHEDMDKAKQYSIVSGYHVKPITKTTFEEMVRTIAKAA